MLKDVGMTVPKSRETSAVYMQQDKAVYMQQDRGWGQYMQQDRGWGYATIVTCVPPLPPPPTSLLLWGFIVTCPHPLSCCIFSALIPCLAAYILPSSPALLHILYCTCFSTFWHCHPYILQHFNGNIFTLFSACTSTSTWNTAQFQISWACCYVSKVAWDY